MNPLHIPATGNSPEVEFRFDAHELLLRGESFPENAAAFYGPVIAALREFLALPDDDKTLNIEVSLTYFNSSSTKMLFSFFEALNDAAIAGNHVVLNWYHDEDDDTILEFGQELQDDFGALDFHDHAVSNE